MDDNYFICYFCHKKIQNEDETGHVSLCANVLEPCPYKCSAYIPRYELLKHRNECILKNNKNSSVSSSKPNTHRNNEEIHQCCDTLKLLSMKVDKLKNFNHNHNHIQYQLELEKIKCNTEFIKEWKRSIEMQIDCLKQTIQSLDLSRRENSYHCLMLQKKINSFYNNFQENFINVNHSTEFSMKFSKLNEQFSNEIEKIFILLNDKNDEIHNIIELKFKELFGFYENLKVKFNNVIYESKTLNQTSSECLEKCEILEINFKDLHKNIETVKLNLENLETTLYNPEIQLPGRFIWKLTKFQEKFSKARECDCIFKSPIFSTHPHGYKIRLILYLNGLQKWKDRYALISLFVLKGDYDPLLKWPCFIEAKITLRDIENSETPKNFSKYINAKRHCGNEESEEPQESSSSFIFIPHSIITKSKFVKNNELFIDIEIINNNL